MLRPNLNLYLLLMIFCLIAYAIFFRSSREGLGDDLEGNLEALAYPGGATKCSTHCNSQGASDFDCCNCLATGTYIVPSDNFEIKYRRCLCKRGHKDYCYRPVTNLLLSQ